MKKMQVFLPEDELEGLRQAAARSGRSVAALIRDAIRQVALKCTSFQPWTPPVSRS
jgi:plasmid stability protein